MPKKYLQDANQRYLQQQIQDWINTEDGSSEYLLLMDGALLTRREHAQLQQQTRASAWCPLYADTAFESMNEYGIQALHFRPSEWDANELMSTLAFYLKVSDKKPTFSIAKLRRPFDIGFWLWLTDLHVEGDEQKYITRFADTHVWPNFYQILNQHHISYIAAFIEAWGIKDRNGNWQVFAFDAEEASPARHEESRLVLSPLQLDTLLDLSEADSVYSVLQEQSRFEMPLHTAEEKHRYLCFLLDKAQTLQITDYGEKRYFIGLFSQQHPDIFTQADIQKALSNINAENSIFDAEAKWPEQVLKQLAV